MNRIVYDKKLNIEVLEISYNRKIYRIPHILNKRYKITGILAIGGIGIIYKAIDTKFIKKKVLIKSLIYNPILFSHRNNSALVNDISFTRRALKIEEAILYHAWSRKIGGTATILDSFNDISLEIYGPHKDTQNNVFYLDNAKDKKGNLLYSSEPYIVINYFSGAPLSFNILDKNQYKPLMFVKNLLQTIATTLWSFHEEFNNYRFIYCDLKPDNILYTKENRIVLIDMGSFAIIKNNSLVGKPSVTQGYSAPELLKNIRIGDLTPAVDIYSLGMIAYSMLTKKSITLDENNETNIDYNLLNKYPEWKNFIIKATEYFPDNRYQSIEDFIKILSLLPLDNYIPKKVFMPFLPRFPLYKALNKRTINNWSINKKIITNNDFFDLFLVTKSIGSILYSAHLLTISKTKINEKYNDIFKSKMLKSFLNNRLNLLTDILSKNHTFLPEIIDKGILDDENYIVFTYPKGKSGIGYKKAGNLYISEIVFLNFVKQVVYLLLSVSKAGLQLQKLDVTDFLKDQSNQLYLINFLSLFNTENIDFLSNPLSKNIVNSIYTAPELDDADGYSDKTLSYILGKMILKYLIGDKKFEIFFKTKSFPSKKEYEPLVNSLPLSNAFKQIIVNLLFPVPSQRATLYDTLVALKKRGNFENHNLIISHKTNSNARKKTNTNIKNKANNSMKMKYNKKRYYNKNENNLKLSITNEMYQYYIDYSSIFNEVSIENKYRINFNKQHSIFTRKPSERYQEFLNMKRESFSVLNQKKLDEILDDDLLLLTDAKKSKFNHLLIIIDDELGMLIDIIKDYGDLFENIYLFSFRNPFKNNNELKNKVKYHDLTRFISKKSRRG